MLIVCNVVKKGEINIPVIPVSINMSNNAVTFGAIDKVENAEFLAQGVDCFAYGKDAPSGVEPYAKFAEYVGDELTISFSYGIGTYSIMLQKHVVTPY